VTVVNRDYRNGQNLVYVIPTEDEWYKAAYFKADGSGYSLYANGSGTAPVISTDGSTGWNYNTASPVDVWTVGTGTGEQNGTYNMMGNIWEWMDDGTGVIRGGRYDSPSLNLRATSRTATSPTSQSAGVGFRVAVIRTPPKLSLILITSFFECIYAPKNIAGFSRTPRY
jgi:formylglycine-generating enzyme required for sulfatase activity